MNWFKMNKKLILPLLAILLILPSVVLGQFPVMPPLTSGVNLFSLIVVISTIILNATWMISVTFVIIMFVIAGFKFLTAQGDPNKVGEARNAVIWGIGGVIVVILAYSILVVMRVTLGI